MDKFWIGVIAGVWIGFFIMGVMVYCRKREGK